MTPTFPCMTHWPEFSQMGQLAAGLLRNVVFSSGCHVSRYKSITRKEGGKRYLGRGGAASTTILLTYLILRVLQYCELDTIDFIDEEAEAQRD